MNDLLGSPSLKLLIKLCVKRPFDITKKSIKNINLSLHPSEYCHIFLLAIRKIIKKYKHKVN